MGGTRCSEGLKVSVVIATYNRRDVIAETLPTVFAQRFPSDRYEVIVVVDGSTDGTAERLRRFQPISAFHILEKPHKGLASARNAGAKAASGSLILFLDDDLLCDPSLIRQHVEAHERIEPLVVLGAVRVVSESPHGPTPPSARAYHEEVFRRRSMQTKLLWPLDAMVPANSSLPRSLFLECGGLDERFIGALEDVDLGLRLWSNGVPFRYQPAATASHLYIKSALDPLTHARFHGKAEVLLCRKHPNYRTHSVLGNLRRGPMWKRLSQQIAARQPVPPEPLFRFSLWITRRVDFIRAGSWAHKRLLSVGKMFVFWYNAVHETGSWIAFQREFGPGGTTPVEKASLSE